MKNKIINICGDQYGLFILTSENEIFIYRNEKISKLNFTLPYSCFPEIYFKKINDFTFNCRIRNGAYNNDIEYVGELIQLKPSDILRWKNVGKATLADLIDDLKNSNLTLETKIDHFPDKEILQSLTI